MLATIRAVAADKQREAGEIADVQRRYRRWAAERAAALVVPGGAEWRAEVDAVLDDLRDALASYPPEPDLAAHGLARSLGRIAHARGFLQEACRRYQQAAAHAGARDQQARDLRAAAECAEVGHDTGGAFDLLVERESDGPRARRGPGVPLPGHLRGRGALRAPVRAARRGG
jgi:hypothetical protein